MADRTPSPQPESPEPLKVPEELLAIQQALDAGPTPGPWIIATSNSWRRIVTAHRMESVCEPITQNDGHPDLYFRNGGASGPDARLIEACNPAAMTAVLAYIAAIQAARNEAETMRRELLQAKSEISDLLQDKLCAADPDRPFGEILAEVKAHPAIKSIDAVIAGASHA